MYDICIAIWSHVHVACDVLFNTVTDISFIQGYGRANAYIAAQGPMPNTIGDFWRMIWEHRLSTIVMLTKVTEGGKVYYVQYKLLVMVILAAYACPFIKFKLHSIYAGINFCQWGKGHYIPSV